jgi:hypothetical protein
LRVFRKIAVELLSRLSSSDSLDQILSTNEAALPGLPDATEDFLAIAAASPQH